MLDQRFIDAATAAFPNAKHIALVDGNRRLGGITRENGTGRAAYDVYAGYPAIHSADWRDHTIMETGEVVAFPIVKVRGKLYRVSDKAEPGAVW